MPSLLLQTDDGAMAGFLRVAGAASLREGPDERSCLLTGVPGEPTLFDPPLSLLVHRCKQREVRLSRSSEDERLWTARFDQGLSLRLEIEVAGTGHWGFDGPGASQARGECLVVPEPECWWESSDAPARG